MVLARLFYNLDKFLGSWHLHPLSLYLQVDLLVLARPIEMFVNRLDQSLAWVNIFDDDWLCFFILIFDFSGIFCCEISFNFGQQPYLRQTFVSFDVQLLMDFDAFTAQNLFAMGVSAEKLILRIVMFEASFVDF